MSFIFFMIIRLPMSYCWLFFFQLILLLWAALRRKMNWIFFSIFFPPIATPSHPFLLVVPFSWGIQLRVIQFIVPMYLHSVLCAVRCRFSVQLRSKEKKKLVAESDQPCTTLVRFTAADLETRFKLFIHFNISFFISSVYCMFLLVSTRDLWRLITRMLAPVFFYFARFFFFFIQSMFRQLNRLRARNRVRER